MTESDNEGEGPLPVLVDAESEDSLEIIGVMVERSELTESAERLGIEIMLRVGTTEMVGELLLPSSTPRIGKSGRGVAFGGKMRPVRVSVTVAVLTGYRGLTSSWTLAHSERSVGRL